MTAAAIGVLFEVAIKSTLLLGAAFLVTGLLRRRSAVERHLVWVLTFVALAALPALVLFGPRFELNMPHPLPALTQSVSQPGVTAPPVSADAMTEPRMPASMMDAAAPNTADNVRAVSTGSASSASLPSNLPSNAASDNTTTDVLQVGVLSRTDIARTILFGYFAVALLLLLRYAGALARVYATLSRYPPLSGSAVAAQVRTLSRSLGIRRQVRLFVARDETAPWSWGVLRPRVIVPELFAEWPAAAQRNALIHELGHIARRDFLTALLARACCALYWFQPLVWLAIRKMHHEAEQACDDKVLLSGSDGASYATQLLDLALAVRARKTPDAAMGMARSHAVTERIVAILHGAPRRATAHRMGAALIFFGMLCLLMPMASIWPQSNEDAAAVAGTRSPERQDLLRCLNPDVVYGLLGSYDEVDVVADMPDELTMISVPGGFDWVGGAVRPTTTIGAFRTRLGASDAVAQAVDALAGDGWTVPQRAPVNLSMVSMPATSATMCRADASISISATADYLRYTVPTESSQRLNPCSPPETSIDMPAIRAGLTQHFPRLQFVDPDTGRQPVVRFSGSGGSTNSTYQSSRVFTDMSASDLSAWLGQQLVEQGWRMDSSWSGSTVTGSMWSKVLESGNEISGVLELRKLRGSGYEVSLRVIRVQEG